MADLTIFIVSLDVNISKSLNATPGAVSGEKDVKCAHNLFLESACNYLSVMPIIIARPPHNINKYAKFHCFKTLR